MAAQPHHIWTVAEYLDFERASPHKHEFYGGQVMAMSGASRHHVRITGNIVAALHPQLRARPCEIYQSDMRLRVSDTGLYTYPDIAVTCGEPHFIDDYVDTLTNPTLIIEVLSPSTEAYDRGRKFTLYQSIPSLQEVLLVAQDAAHIEQYTHQPDGSWLLRESVVLDAILELHAINCTLAFVDVYSRILSQE